MFGRRYSLNFRSILGIIKSMYNWSVDVKKLSKYPQKHTVWKLEQLINFGLNGRKLKLSELRKHFNKLNLDPQKKKYISFLLSE